MASSPWHPSSNSGFSFGSSQPSSTNTASSFGSTSSSFQPPSSTPRFNFGLPDTQPSNTSGWSFPASSQPSMSSNGFSFGVSPPLPNSNESGSSLYEVCNFGCENPICENPHPSTSSTIDDEFLCGICQDLMFFPLSCCEGHTWCKSCIEQWVLQKEECPIDRQPLSLSGLTRNRPLENMISKLDVYCAHQRLGCSWIGHRHLYQEHAVSCLFVLTPCEYCKIGVAVNEMGCHKKSCEFAPMTCPNFSFGCEWSGERRQYEEHVSTCANKPQMRYGEDGTPKYEGGILNNHKHGRGLLFNEHGVAYDGCWEIGRRHGDGMSYTNDGGLEYDGMWLNNFKHGHGALYGVHGKIIYDGEWKHNRRHGVGISYNESGHIIYDGEWKHNRRSGQGVSYSVIAEEIKTEFEGVWYNDNFTKGHGYAYDKKGRLIYQGQWKNGNRHGQGTAWIFDNCAQDGAKFKGHWENGKRNGFGILYQSARGFGIGPSNEYNKLYEGQWKEDQKHGPGTSFTSFGDTIEFQGEWESGRPIKR